MTTGKKSLYLLISLVVIVFGYCFLFFGNNLGKNKHSLLSELGAEYNINEHYFTLESWIFDPNSRKMEIVFSINNKSFDGNDEYQCAAMSRKDGSIHSEILVNTRDLLVIHLTGMHREFGEISLRIFFDDITEDNPLKVYTNQNKVKVVNEIQARSVNQYYIERNERTIKKYLIENEEYTKKINELNTKIKNAEISISDLNNQSEYKTETELKTINREIENIKSEIVLYNKDIDTYESIISENENRIENIKEENKILSEK